MNAILHRFAYTPDEIQGRLVIDDQAFWTIERPWVRGDKIGGKPFESAVPDGEYDLVPFERSNGDHVLALVNPDLGVGLHSGNRYAILIHVGNYVDDVVGCISPGMERAISQNRIMVTGSRMAMTSIEQIMPFDQIHTLTIKPTAGTV